MEEYITGAILVGMAVLCQWFLNPEEPNSVSGMPAFNRQREKGILLLFDLVFLIASLIPPQIPVILR